MLLPFQGASPNIHRPRALPWAGCLLAFQAVTSQKLYRTPIAKNKFLSGSPKYDVVVFVSVIAIKKVSESVAFQILFLFYVVAVLTAVMSA